MAKANVNMVGTDLTPLTKPANFRKPSQAPNKMKSVVSNPEKWNPNAMPFKAKAGFSFNIGNPHQSNFCQANLFRIWQQQQEILYFVLSVQIN